MDPKRSDPKTSGETWLVSLALGAGVIVLVSTILPTLGVSAPEVRIDGMVGILMGR
ncbi:MAG: hypothetical protein AAF366_08020 [Pseudomonadota bacterium]